MIPRFVLENMQLKTSKEFKQLKRKQLKEVKRVTDEYQSGCAFCPEYESTIEKFFKTLNRMLESHKVKNWRG